MTLEDSATSASRHYGPILFTVRLRIIYTYWTLWH